jgi:DNA repair ATPase RecN
MVDFDQVQLARGLNVPAHEVVRVQDKCQRYLDELEDSQEALELLRIIKNAKQESNTEAQSLSENSQEGSTSQSYVTEDQPTRKRTKKS